MLKTMNLDGPGYDSVTSQFVRDSGTNAIILPMPRWDLIQPQAPYFDGPGYDITQCRQIDEQAAQVLADGRRLLLAPMAGYPPWSYARRAQKVGKTPGKAARLAPDDLTPTGPWARYLRFVMQRYPKAIPIVLNEPNFGFIEDAPTMGKQTAQMLKTAASVAARVGCPHILGPAMADTSDPRGFTEGVLKALNWPWGKYHGWQPPKVTVGWAHHPYVDIKRGNVTGIQHVLALLAKYRWHSGSRIWLTEGGYQYNVHQDPNPDYSADPATWHYNEPLSAQEHTQLVNVSENYAFCKGTGSVELWAQYGYRDSLWGGWASGLIAYDGTPHPLAAEWAKL